MPGEDDDDDNDNDDDEDEDELMSYMYVNAGRIVRRASNQRRASIKQDTFDKGLICSLYGQFYR